MLTKEEIENLIQEKCDDFNSRESVAVLLKQAISDALALDAAKRAKPEPARKPWPKLPCSVSAKPRENYGVYDAVASLVCQNSFKSEAEAIALALNELPECVAWMKEHAQEFRRETAGPYLRERRERRDAILARISASGFDLPEK